MFGRIIRGPCPARTGAVRVGYIRAPGEVVASAVVYGFFRTVSYFSTVLRDVYLAKRERESNETESCGPATDSSFFRL